jgi:hypothetical protein
MDLKGVTPSPRPTDESLSAAVSLHARETMMLDRAASEALIAQARTALGAPPPEDPGLHERPTMMLEGQAADELQQLATQLRVTPSAPQSAPQESAPTPLPEQKTRIKLPPDPPSRPSPALPAFADSASDAASTMPGSRGALAPEARSPTRSRLAADPRQVPLPEARHVDPREVPLPEARHVGLHPVGDPFDDVDTDRTTTPEGAHGRIEDPADSGVRVKEEDIEE